MKTKIMGFVGWRGREKNNVFGFIYVKKKQKKKKANFLI
jgi:hypothetical protein